MKENFKTINSMEKERLPSTEMPVSTKGNGKTDFATEEASFVMPFLKSNTMVSGIKGRKTEEQESNRPTETFQWFSIKTTLKRVVDLTSAVMALTTMESSKKTSTAEKEFLSKRLKSIQAHFVLASSMEWAQSKIYYSMKKNGSGRTRDKEVLSTMEIFPLTASQASELTTSKTEASTQANGSVIENKVKERLPTIIHKHTRVSFTTTL